MFVNPLVEIRNTPPGDPVPADHMAAFEALRDRLHTEMTGSAPALAEATGPPGPPASFDAGGQ